jgi:AcrR family transcriptional regulator
VPKRVDHEQRRAEIARALWRVIDRQGLEGVSVRHVAAEAGVSAGMVQYHFRTRDEMMTFVMEGLRAQGGARMAAKGHALATASPGTVVRELLVELLPLDEERRLEGHVAVALAAYAAVHPEAVAAEREGVGALQAFVADRLRAAQKAGTASLDLDPDHEAIAMTALVEGLNMITQVGRLDADTTRAVFDTHLRMLFGEPDLGR